MNNEELTGTYYSALFDINGHLASQAKGNVGMLDLEKIVEKYKFNADETEILRRYASKVRGMLYTSLTNAHAVREEKVTNAIFKQRAIQKYAKELFEKFRQDVWALEDETVEELKMVDGGRNKMDDEELTD